MNIVHTIKLTPVKRQKTQSGFTLIELMITIIIIGVLAKIAIPAYTTSVQKANRNDAKNALLDLASREEKYFSVNNNYTTSLSNLNYGTTNTSINIQSGSTAYYTLTIASAVAASAASGTTAATAATYSATAAPISGTTQANDACGTFTINYLGVTGNSGNSITTCW